MPPPLSSAPAFDMNAILAAFAQMQQQQGAQRLQGQQAQLDSMDPLGTVARSNSRPSGMSTEASWRNMFPTAPTGQGYFGDAQATPPTVSARDAAFAASPEPFMPDQSGRGLGFTGPTPQPQYDPQGQMTNLPQMEQQYRDFYSPGGWQEYAKPAPLQQVGPPMSLMGQPQPKASSPKKPKGALGSPRPGFSFSGAFQ